MWYRCTIEYYLAIRNVEYLSFTLIWMEPEGIMLSEISQSEKHNYHYGFTQMPNMRNSAEDHKGSEGKLSGKKIREGDKP